MRHLPHPAVATRGVLVVETSGRVIFANAEAGQLLGRPLHDMRSVHLNDLFEHADTIADVLTLATRGLRWSAIVLTPRRADRKVQAEIRATGDDSDTLVIVMHRI